MPENVTDNAQSTFVTITAINMNCQKMIIAASAIAITNQTLIATYPPTCLYKVLQVS